MILESGTGVWDALVFTASFLTIFITVFVASRLLFNTSYKKGSQQEPFLAGNRMPEDFHLWASNLYWGFTKALKRYYAVITPEHTGNINTYMSWFVLVTAILMILLGVTV